MALSFSAAGLEPAVKYIKSLVHGTTIYQFGEKWPGAKELAADDIDQLTVGPIFFRWGTEEDIGGQPPTTDVTPCYYEVFCVTREMFVKFFGAMASKLLGGDFVVDEEGLRERMRLSSVTVREFPHSKVEFVDNEMPSLEAFNEIKLRLREAADQEATDDEEFDEGDDVDEIDEPVIGGNGQAEPP